MADVSQRENILISSFGQGQVLVALPESPGAAGGAQAVFPTTSGVKVELYRSFPNNLNNGFSQVSVYRVTVNSDTKTADQRFTVQQATNPVNVLISGTIHLEADWAIPMESIQVVMPAHGLNGQPLSVGVEPSGSTGYSWSAATYGQLQVSSHIYPPKNPELIGSPALELFSIMPTGADSCSSFQLQELSPTRQNTGYINVSVVTRSSNE